MQCREEEEEGGKQGVASYLPALESASCIKLAWMYGYRDHRTRSSPYINGNCGHRAREISARCEK